MESGSCREPWGVATLSPLPAPRASGGAAPRRPRGERSARAVTLAQRPRGALGCSFPSTRAGSVLGVSLAAGGCCFQVTPDASPEWPELGCCVLTHYVFVFRGDWEEQKQLGARKSIRDPQQIARLRILVGFLQSTLKPRFAATCSGKELFLMSFKLDSSSTFN